MIFLKFILLHYYKRESFNFINSVIQYQNQSFLSTTQSSDNNLRESETICQLSDS